MCALLIGANDQFGDSELVAISFIYNVRKSVTALILTGRTSYVSKEFVCTMHRII